MQYTFGVDVGGTAIKYGLFGDGLIEKWASPTRVDANGSQILPDIAAALAACQARHSITPGPDHWNRHRRPRPGGRRRAR